MYICHLNWNVKTMKIKKEAGIGKLKMSSTCSQCYKTFWHGNLDFPKINKFRDVLMS